MLTNNQIFNKLISKHQHIEFTKASERNIGMKMDQLEDAAEAILINFDMDKALQCLYRGGNLIECLTESQDI